MCGRIIDPDLRNTEVEFAQLKIQPFSRRFNVKPTQPIVILAKSPLEAMMARWGLVPSWHNGELSDWKASTFNARLEDAKSKPTFRNVWRYGRCLIPVGGFYEWTGPRGYRQPHVFQAAGNENTLYLAGLASRWNDLLTCTILTRAANDAMRDIHDRMPVVLNLEERDAWLGGSDDQTLGAGAQLLHHPVAPFGIEAEGPELIEELR